MRKSLILLFSILYYFFVNGQGCSSVRVLEPTEYYAVEPLPQIEAKHVMWYRRLWREIDLTEKINQLLYFPNEKEERNCCLFDILNMYIGKGIIKAYSTEDDKFTKQLTLAELNVIAGDSIMKDGKLIFKPLDTKDITKIWLKEDWFYDSKYSKIEVRIIGICPVKIKYDQNGNTMGYKQLFWLYFPHIRDVLASYEAFKKTKEDDPRVSFDDVFIARMFNSYIVNREKDNDMYVNKNKTELDIKLENQQSRNYYRIGSKGLWGY